MGIDWNEMGGNYVSLTNGEPKKMLLSNWRQQEKFEDDEGNIKFGVTFDVLEEDGKDLSNDPKEYTVTAISALKELKPLIEKAEANGKENLKVSIVRVGKGKNTQYNIKEIGENAEGE